MTNNEMQGQILDDLTELAEAMKRKINILSALSRDGGYDLHDQITHMCEMQGQLEQVLAHSHNILPCDGLENKQEPKAC